MRMPDPEEDKVTATGGGLRASGLQKLGSVRRSLLKKGLFVLQCALTESFHAVCCCACVLFLTGRLDSLAYGYEQPNSDFQTTLTTLSGLHLTHTFVLQSAWSTLHVSLREASLRMHMSSIQLLNLSFTLQNLTQNFFGKYAEHQEKRELPYSGKLSREKIFANW